jgi:sugar lactone lactonase YvrE
MSSLDVGLSPVPGWEQRPDDVAHRDVSAVGVDSADRVYLFTRSDDQILVYSRDGVFLRAWGKGVFTNAHGLTIGPDDSVYCVDNGDHSVRKFSADGTLLLTLGVPGKSSDTGFRPNLPPQIHSVETVQRPGPPFNGCTGLAVGPGGDLFVSDGYGNCRIHRFSRDGTLLHSWGTVGSGPGEFRLPHAICATPDGRLLVADRENDRIQIFSTGGEYVGEWHNIRRPCGLAVAPDGTVFVGELWRPVGNSSFVTDTSAVDEPSRMSVLTPSGELITRWGDSADDKSRPGNFIAPHSLAFDSSGSLYVAEVTYTYAIKTGRLSPVHASHQIQKFERAPTARTPAIEEG